MQRIDYGSHPDQYAEWSPAEGAPGSPGKRVGATGSRGIVVVIHGGFWRAPYDLSLGRPLAADLHGRGWSTLNLEYRRLGTGGGTPQTFDDVAAGIDLLADLAPDHDGPVIALGHSAGGHLAVWAAGRRRHGWPERTKLTHVLAQAGALDLRAGNADHLSRDAVEEFLGHAPTEADLRFDPRQQVPLDVPVWCLHAPDDTHVPISQSRDYVAAAKRAGARADLVEVTGGHLDLIDPGSAAWAQVVQVLDGL